MPELKQTAGADEPFVSFRKPAYDSLLDGSKTPDAAIEAVRAFEAQHGSGPAAVYISTAITSGGFQPSPPNPAVFATSKRQNEELAARLINAMLAARLVLTPTNLLVPTELGTVPHWSDIDYLEFYFAYARGLSEEQARAFRAAVAQRTTTEQRGVANNRLLPNESRWPAYREVTTVMLEVLDDIASAENVPFPEMQILLQLIDTGRSLGCQAEQLFAKHFAMDIVAPAVDVTALSGFPILAAQLTQLRQAGVPPFVAASAVMPVPIDLNARESDA